jgi:transglutaminase-like putative cysteine protease
MYLKIHSKRGAGGWSFKYREKGERLVDFTWTITLSNRSSNATITRVEARVPFIRTFHPYQQVLESYSNFQHRNIATDNLGNYYYVFDILNLGPNCSVDLVMNYKILLKADYSDPAACEGVKISGFLSPEPLIESNDPYIIGLAGEITKDDTTDCDRTESIYRYVMERLVYKFQTPMDGALKALKSGKGDCNEFTDAIIALSRASGIPAKKGNGFVFFGENNIVAHAFPEVFLPGRGWSVVDATMYCLFKRPPFYIYAYSGENPSLLVRPDMENHHFTCWWNDGRQHEFSYEDRFEGRELR